MSLSLTGVACLSKSNIRRGVRGLHGPVRKDAGAAVDGVADSYRDLGFARKPNVHARAETDKANAFASRYGFAGFLPRNDTAGDEAGDLFELDVAAGRGKREDVLFVLCRGFGIPGGHEFAGAIVYFCDGAGKWSAVDVNVPDREENADTSAGATGVFFFGDDDDATVGGGDNGVRIGRGGAIGIAKKGK